MWYLQGCTYHLPSSVAVVVVGMAQMRRRYRKIYEDYRPEMMAWRLVGAQMGYELPTLTVSTDSPGCHGHVLVSPDSPLSRPSLG